MAQQQYRPPPRQQPYPPQYQGACGPGQEEYDYGPPRRKSPLMIASIILGVFCLGLLILLMVVWSGKGSASSRLLDEMATNRGLITDRDTLKRKGHEVKQKIALLERQASAKRSDTPAPGAGAPEGTARYWKARYEEAKRGLDGFRFEANRCKAKLDFASRKNAESSGSPATQPAPPTPPDAGT